MEAIKTYLKSNVESFKTMKLKQTQRMEELQKLSQDMQTEFNNLEASNKFIDDLLSDIALEFKQEGENNGTKENLHST